MDPETGAAGYMISGGLAGGFATMDIQVNAAFKAIMMFGVHDALIFVGLLISAGNPVSVCIWGGVLMLTGWTSYDSYLAV